MHFDESFDVIRNVDLPGWLGFLGFWAVFGEMTDFIAIVTGRPGGWIPFGL